MSDRDILTMLADMLFEGDVDDELKTVKTFEEAGVLSMDDGLVVTFQDGSKYALTLRQM